MSKTENGWYVAWVKEERPIMRYFYNGCSYRVADPFGEPPSLSQPHLDYCGDISQYSGWRRLNGESWAVMKPAPGHVFSRAYYREGANWCGFGDTHGITLSFQEDGRDEGEEWVWGVNLSWAMALLVLEGLPHKLTVHKLQELGFGSNGLD